MIDLLRFLIKFLQTLIILFSIWFKNSTKFLLTIKKYVNILARSFTSVEEFLLSLSKISHNDLIPYLDSIV